MLTRHGEGRRVPARILPPGPARRRLIGKCNLLWLDPPNKASDRSLMCPVTVALSPTRTRARPPIREAIATRPSGPSERRYGVRR